MACRSVEHRSIPDFRARRLRHPAQAVADRKLAAVPAVQVRHGHQRKRVAGQIEAGVGKICGRQKTCEPVACARYRRFALTTCTRLREWEGSRPSGIQETKMTTCKALQVAGVRT